jgi:phosphatidate cytidylyltransferase
MLKTRILTALLLLAFFIPAVFYLSNIIWAFVMLGLSLLAVYEWGTLSGFRENAKRKFVGLYLFIGVLLINLLYQDNFHSYIYIALFLSLITFLFWVCIVPFIVGANCLIKNKPLVAFIGLMSLLAFWMALVSTKYIDPLLLLSLVATIWLSDSSAYFFGKNFGKHKLAPTISPGKTWEGVVGALLAVSLFAIVLKLSSVVSSWLVVPALCCVAILGVYGDLFESMLKRQQNLKDSGDILPGHGGVLDRIDAIIPTLPVALLVLYIYHYIIAL